MKFFSNWFLFGLFLVFLISIPAVHAETILVTLEGGMDIKITHPNSVVAGRTFPISVLVENNGWEDKSDVNFLITGSSESIKPILEKKIEIDRISAGGSYGDSIDFNVLPNATIGKHFLNVIYSHILVANNVEPQEPLKTNLALPIIIKSQPKVSIHTTTPESIFTNAEFSFKVELVSEDVDLENIKVEIISPKDIDFRGETLHTFSSIQKNVPITITSQISTPKEEIITEYKVPFQILVSYKDDLGDEKTDSQTVSLLLRPRTFMELTTDGGIWVGDFFIAPYVSLGTVIGIPAGALLSLAIRKSQKKKKKKKTKR